MLVKPGDEVLNPRLGQKEKIARLFSVHANRRDRLDKAGTGEIVLAMGLRHAGTGDTVCAPAAPIMPRFTAAIQIGTSARAAFGRENAGTFSFQNSPSQRKPPPFCAANAARNNCTSSRVRAAGFKSDEVVRLLAFFELSERGVTR